MEKEMAGHIKGAEAGVEQIWRRKWQMQEVEVDIIAAKKSPRGLLHAVHQKASLGTSRDQQRPAETSIDDCPKEPQKVADARARRTKTVSETSTTATHSGSQRQMLARSRVLMLGFWRRKPSVQTGLDVR